MSRIKTALELAMEKMDSIQVDEQKIRRENLRQEARGIAGKYLEDDRMQDEELKEKLSIYKEADKALVYQTINSTILQNLSLPSNIEFKTRNIRIKSLFTAMNGTNQEAIELVSQVLELEDQYFESMSSLLDNLKEQYKDALAQSNVPPEQNKDFLNLYQSNVKKMNQQFTSVLTQAKDQLKALLGLED